MRPIVLIALAGTACGGIDPEPAAPVPLVPDTADAFEDTHDDPNIFEASLSAREANIDIGPEVVRMLTYGARVPGPEIRVVQGDRVIVHLDNDLPADFPTTIHWHGIEGSNAMDGTPTTQGPIQPGESFTYDFQVPRPGLFWFHPHIRGAQSTHSGLYGTLIVDDPDDATLVDMGVLPETRHTLVLSDLSTYEQGVINVESDDDLVLMNGTEGEHLLVNGRVRPNFEVPSGEGVRLQLLNTSITRYWVVSVPGEALVRVGGEGGLLERARIEGGSITADTIDEATGEVVGTETIEVGHRWGTILLGPAERADVVVTPTGLPGETLDIRWEDFARGRHGMWLEGDEMVMGDAKDDGERPGRAVATLEIVAGTAGYVMGDGDPVLAAVGRQVAPVDTEPAGAPMLEFIGEARTELSETMEMIQVGNSWVHEAEFFIDGQSWHPEMTGPSQPMAPTARYARIGDTIEWEVHNSTTMAHPFHLHGFSYQPIAYVWHGDGDEEGHRDGHEAETVARWEWPMVEYEDTTHIPSGASLLFRVHLDDPNGDGGAAGRWMKHCHIFQHGESGMMSELVVTP